MTARLRSKNERMMLDLLDQIKNLPTDLSSDEFDSLQVIFRSTSHLLWIRLYFLRNWTQVHPIQVMNRSCQTAWLRCWRYLARQKSGPCVVEAVKRMNTSGYRVQSLMRWSMDCATLKIMLTRPQRRKILIFNWNKIIQKIIQWHMPKKLITAILLILKKYEVYR